MDESGAKKGRNVKLMKHPNVGSSGRDAIYYPVDVKHLSMLAQCYFRVWSTYQLSGGGGLEKLWGAPAPVDRTIDRHMRQTRPEISNCQLHASED